MSCVNQNTFFTGGTNNFIKPYQGEFVAVSGANMLERLSIADLRIPYNQVLKSRVILKAGQTNYLLNFLGLGDNATFLMIKSTFDPLSKMESDNFIQYSFYSDRTRVYSFSSMMVLTGNSQNRIEQLYLSNPNPDKQVILEVMCAVIDDTYTYFEDNNQTVNNNITFSNLLGKYVVTWKKDVVMAILNEQQIPQVYINISDINTWRIEGKIVVIVDSSYGSLYLDFISEAEAKQGLSNIAWIYETGGEEGVIMQSDTTSPILWFTNDVFEYGTSTLAVYSKDAHVYEATQLSLSVYTLIGSEYVISKLDVANHVIYKFICGAPILDSNGVATGNTCDSCNLSNSSPSFFNSGCYRIYDNRDGLISINENSLVIKKEGAEYFDIRTTGLYTLTFNIEDMAGNKINSNISVKINVVN